MLKSNLKNRQTKNWNKNLKIEFRFSIILSHILRLFFFQSNWKHVHLILRELLTNYHHFIILLAHITEYPLSNWFDLNKWMIKCTNKKNFFYWIQTNKQYIKWSIGFEFKGITAYLPPQNIHLRGPKVCCFGYILCKIVRQFRKKPFVLPFLPPFP